MIPTREDAWALMTEHTQSESLRKHMLAVECAMRAYAAKFGEDVELWGACGLVHDFDFEEHPGEDEHPLGTANTLKELGWPEEIVAAVLAHGTRLDVPRDTLMAKTLFAVDELTGFISACALVRPGKTIEGLRVKSVRKKWKSKGFARAISREDMEVGAADLGVELPEHITFVIQAMQGCAETLGLAGE